MHPGACVALARAHTELNELVAQQCALVLGVMAKPLLRKIFEPAPLVCEVVDTHFVPVTATI
jgi:hypothetical protein